MKHIKENFRRMDKILLIFMFILTIFGLVMILSASNVAAVLEYNKKETYFFTKQAIIVGISLFLFFIIINIKINRKLYLILSWLLMGIAIVTLGTLRISGVITNNAQSWLPIFGFKIQPSEFAKTAIIIYIAVGYGYHRNFKNMFSMLAYLIPCLFAVALVALEPDLGTASIMLAVIVLMFLSLPVKDNKLKVLKISLLLLCVVGYLGLYGMQGYFEKKESSSTQESRLLFTSPCSRYQDDTGYQVCNGFIAINNGGLFGVGLGKSTQKYLYLPEAYTDFIFPIIMEELGVLGGVFILILYLVLLYHILLIATNSTDLIGSLIAFGTFSYILMHILVNLGGVLGLIPLTGVPLPFLSYGGSYTLNLFILLGLVERVAIKNKNDTYQKEFKKALG